MGGSCAHYVGIQCALAAYFPGPTAAQPDPTLCGLRSEPDRDCGYVSVVFARSCYCISTRHITCDRWTSCMGPHDSSAQSGERPSALSMVCARDLRVAADLLRSGDVRSGLGHVRRNMGRQPPRYYRGICCGNGVCHRAARSACVQRNACALEHTIDVLVAAPAVLRVLAASAGGAACL